LTISQEILENRVTNEIKDDLDEGESAEKAKRQTLNLVLLVIGLLVAGISFVWHIVSIFFKG